jgi:hypothetical protein
MSTQEERITALEQTTREHHLTLQNFTYDLVVLKELTITQINTTQELKEDIDASFKQLADYQIKTENQIDARFDQVDARFNQVDTRLDNIEATMATKEDMHAMENRILTTLQQFVTLISTQRPPL